MEDLINQYPNIVEDFPQLIKFSFNEALSYFKEKINSFESEYYILINPNQSLLVSNSKFGGKHKIINEIINLVYDLKSKHSSCKIKIFTYKKYVKEIIEINEEKNKENDKEKISDLILKEIKDSPKSDIITSLSSLYSKIQKSSNNTKNIKNKILKIILINNEMQNYKSIHEKIFTDEKLQNILNEFINEKSYFFGVELKFLDDRIIMQKRTKIDKISDFPSGQIESDNDDSKEENITIIKSIYLSDEMLKKSEKLSLNLCDKWNDIIINETLNEGINKLDELLKFYKDIMNSIMFMKYKVKINKNNNYYKDKYVTKINNYISSQNLNDKRNDIISSDFYESFVQEINSYKEKIEEINLESLNKKINENKGFKDCVCWIKIINYLFYQKKYIIQFLDILKKSTTLVDLLVKEIIKKSKEVIFNEEENKINAKNDEEDDENEEDEENEDDFK